LDDFTIAQLMLYSVRPIPAASRHRNPDTALPFWTERLVSNAPSSTLPSANALPPVDGGSLVKSSCCPPPLGNVHRALPRGPIRIPAVQSKKAADNQDFGDAFCLPQEFSRV
jgi:hypothetical protein